jgi:hypothetical protein
MWITKGNRDVADDHAKSQSNRCVPRFVDGDDISCIHFEALPNKGSGHRGQGLPQRASRCATRETLWS